MGDVVVVFGYCFDVVESFLDVGVWSVVGLVEGDDVNYWVWFFDVLGEE